MDLITKLDDERLDSFDYSGGNADWNITLRSLRAALEERDSWKRDSESLRKEIQRWYDKLQASDSDLDAALSREAGLQRQLCTAREIIEKARSVEEDEYVAEVGEALSLSSSCPHEAEVSQYKAELEAVYKALNTKIVNDDRIRELEEAVVNAAFATFRLLEIGAPPAAGMNHILKMAGETKTYSNPDEANAELRRRAGKEG